MHGTVTPFEPVCTTNLTGFRLLPRLAEPPYDEATCWYRIDSINENGEVQGFIQPLALDTRRRPSSGRPTNPGTIHVIEARSRKKPNTPEASEVTYSQSTTKELRGT